MEIKSKIDIALCKDSVIQQQAKASWCLLFQESVEQLQYCVRFCPWLQGQSLPAGLLCKACASKLAALTG